MSILFWRSTKESAAHEVNELRHFPTQIIGGDNPLASLPAVSGRSVFVQRQAPGIGTGSAYADGDVMGTGIEFPNVFRPERLSGLCVFGMYYDLDDEGLQVDLHLFARQLTSPGADNAAVNPSDIDLTAYRGSLQFTTFSNWSSNQVSQVVNAGLHLFSETTSIWGYPVARGALNIAAANIPVFGLCVLPD